MDYERPGVAETYRRGRVLPAAALDLWRDVLRALVSPREVARAADIGCGTGRFTAWLADVFDAPVIGIEPAAAMLAAAPPAPRVRYVNAAGEALPVRARALDLAFLSLVYHHLADPVAVAGELHRALRPGGRVVLRTATREILDGFAYLGCFPDARALDERRMPSRAALRSTFTAAGFRETAQQIVQQPVARGPEAYVARVGQRALSNLQQIPDAAFTRGMEALRERCRPLPADHVFREPLDVFVFASC
ncbi:MAG TPA: methyltransferase domain-containing protein [Methylomirabilota bacterium]|nr:methyltransferase domain-containing protein [Methylomirabilota bacterium]